MKKLKITIDAKGEVSVQVVGIAGASCLGATEFLEAALGGKVETRELTADYYATTVEGESVVKTG